MNRVTIVIIPFKNDIRFFDILDSILESNGEFNVLVVDNNLEPKIKRMVEEYPVKYVHNGNKGQLAGACNLAVRMIDTEYFIYVCSNHLKIYDKDWVDAMVKEMDDSKADIGGTETRFDGKVHIQGGVFIARTEILKKYPYDSINFPFTFMDVALSDTLHNAGAKFLNMRNVKSVMGDYKRTMAHKVVHAHLIR